MRRVQGLWPARPTRSQTGVRSKRPREVDVSARRTTTDETVNAEPLDDPLGSDLARRRAW